LGGVLVPPPQPPHPERTPKAPTKIRMPRIDLQLRLRAGMPKIRSAARAILPPPAHGQTLFFPISFPIVTAAAGAVVPMETVPPVPLADPAANVTVVAVMVQVGKSVAPDGEAVRVQLLRVTVFGPV